MNDSVESIENDFFHLALDQGQENNQRTAIRYVRTDIEVSVSSSNPFNLSRHLAVTLLDISSKGASIQCSTDFSTKAKVTLNVIFEHNINFTIPAKVVYKSKSINQIKYGLNFSQFHHDLADKIVETSQTLKVK